MTKQRRYITFYKISKHGNRTYGMMCTRSWWKCVKLGFRHVFQGKATMFSIRKVK